MDDRVGRNCPTHNIPYTQSGTSGKWYCKLCYKEREANQQQQNYQGNVTQFPNTRPQPPDDSKVRSMAISYAKDMLVAGKIDFKSFYTVAQDIVNWIKGTSQEVQNVEKVFSTPAPQDVNPNFNQEVPNEMPPMNQSDMPTFDD